MERPIVGFHRDPAGEWVAELECGHQRHVRHNPPWEDHAWVLEEASRRDRLGTPLPCAICDAKLQGLCNDGAPEAARRAK